MLVFLGKALDLTRVGPAALDEFDERETNRLIANEPGLPARNHRTNQMRVMAV